MVFMILASTWTLPADTRNLEKVYTSCCCLPPWALVLLEPQPQPSVPVDYMCAVAKPDEV